MASIMCNDVEGEDNWMVEINLSDPSLLEKAQSLLTKQQYLDRFKEFDAENTESLPKHLTASHWFSFRMKIEHKCVDFFIKRVRFHRMRRFQSRSKELLRYLEYVSICLRNIIWFCGKEGHENYIKCVTNICIIMKSEWFCLIWMSFIGIN